MVRELKPNRSPNQTTGSLTRRKFILGAVAAVSSPNRSLSGELNLREFGAIGDGVVDDSVALRNALCASVSTGQTLYVPSGRYRVSTIPLDLQMGMWSGQTMSVRGDGPFASVFVSTPRIGRNNQGISGPILLADSPRAISLVDIGLDGGMSKVVAPLRDRSGDQPFSLVEIRNCSDVSLIGVVSRNNMHQRSNRDIQGASFGRSGPVFLFRCSNVKMLLCGSRYPSFREGWWLVNCRNVSINDFSHQGPAEFDRFATSTPLNIVGPETENIQLTDCNISNAIGSSLNLGGKGGFSIRNCKFRGVITPTMPVERGFRPQDPGLGGFGKGIDLGAEHQEDFYVDHPSLSGILIENCDFESLFSYSIRLTKRKWCPASDITISSSRLHGGHRGIEIGSCERVTIVGNEMSQICRPVSVKGRFGRTIIISDSLGIHIENNYLDGTADPFMGTSDTELPIQEPQVGIFMSAADHVTIKDNEFVGFIRAQVLIQPKNNLVPRDILIARNTFRLRQITRSRIGSKKPFGAVSGPLDGVTMRENKYEPLDEDLAVRRKKLSTR